MKFKNLITVILASASCFFIPLTHIQAASPHNDNFQYLYVDLGALPSEINSSEAEKINDEGNITGISPSNLGDSVFYWNKNNLQEITLDIPNAYNRKYAYSINNKDQIVGVFGQSDHAHGFIWSLNRSQDLFPLAGFPDSSAYGINDNGDVVGNSSQQPIWYDKTPVSNNPEAELWIHGHTVDLGSLPGGNSSSALAINNKGEIVGHSAQCNGATENSCSNIHGVLWKDGNINDLGVLDSTINYSIARGLNDNEQIVGSSKASDGNNHAVLWESNQIIDLGIFPGGNESFATGINNSGQVVGWSDAGPTIGDRAFMWDSKNGMRDLNNLTNTNGTTLTEALGINKKGDIVGGAVSADGSTHGFLLIKK